MPKNLFFGVLIAVCIIVLKKSKQDNNVLFIDASKEFIHEGNKNKLSEENIQKIYSAYMERKDVEHFACLKENHDIQRNNSNLSVSSYVTMKDNSEKVDIKKLNEEISGIVSRETELRKKVDAIVNNLEN